MASRRAAALLAPVLFAVLAPIVAGGGVWCAFSSKATDAGNTFTSAADWKGPTTSARAIGRVEGGTAGFVRPGGTYNVYAQAADTGNPASGISSVTANVSAITSGQTAVSLASGSFSFGGASYNHRTSSPLTVSSGLAEKTYEYSLKLTDAAGNTTNESSYTVTVDGTAPTAADIQTTNKAGGTAGLPELGDKVVFTFSEPPEPSSILAGWSGSSTSVVARIDDNTAASGNDLLTVFNPTNKTQLALGSVDLGRTDYVGASRTFGASGTASTMVLSGSAITVTLGTQSGAGTTAASTGTMVWSPSTTATDRAGNPMSATTQKETGSADKDF
jgi:hypothetical protein